MIMRCGLLFLLVTTASSLSAATPEPPQLEPLAPQLAAPQPSDAQPAETSPQGSGLLAGKNDSRDVAEALPTLAATPALVPGWHPTFRPLADRLTHDGPVLPTQGPRGPPSLRLG